MKEIKYSNLLCKQKILCTILKRDSNKICFQLWGLASIDEVLSSFMTYQTYPWKDISFKKWSTLITTFSSSAHSSYNLPHVFTSQLTLYILKSTIIYWQWSGFFSGFILFGFWGSMWYILICMYVTVHVCACIYIYVYVFLAFMI